MTVHACPVCARTFARRFNLDRHLRRRTCVQPIPAEGWRPGGTTGDRKLDAAIGRFIHWPEPLPCDYDTEEDAA